MARAVNPQTGEVIEWDGTQWVAVPPSTGLPEMPAVSQAEQISQPPTVPSISSRLFPGMRPQRMQMPPVSGVEQANLAEQQAQRVENAPLVSESHPMYPWYNVAKKAGGAALWPVGKGLEALGALDKYVVDPLAAQPLNWAGKSIFNVPETADLTRLGGPPSPALAEPSAADVIPQFSQADVPPPAFNRFRTPQAGVFGPASLLNRAVNVGAEIMPPAKQFPVGQLPGEMLKWYLYGRPLTGAMGAAWRAGKGLTRTGTQAMGEALGGATERFPWKLTRKEAPAATPQPTTIESLSETLEPTTKAGMMDAMEEEFGLLDKKLGAVGLGLGAPGIFSPEPGAQPPNLPPRQQPQNDQLKVINLLQAVKNLGQ